MKKVFSVLAVAAMLLVSFSACTGDETYADLLTQKKGWVLSTAHERREDTDKNNAHNQKARIAILNMRKFVPHNSRKFFVV